MEEFCRALLHRRHRVVAAAAVLGLGAALLALHIRFEFSFTQFFPSATHPAVAAYFAHMQRFGRDENVAIVAIAPRQGGVFTLPTLQRIADASQQLSALVGVERVDSLSATRLPQDDVDGLAARPLYNTTDLGQNIDLMALQRRAMSQPLLQSNLVDSKSQAAAIVVTLAEDDEAGLRDSNDVSPTLQSIASIATSQFPNESYQLHLGGVPFVRAGYISLLQAETWQLMLAASLLLFIVLYFFFRTWRAVALPFAVVALSTLLSVALLQAVGQSFTLMSTLIPTIVLIIGIADSVHFVARFQEEYKASGVVVDAVVQTFRHLALACLLTSATTAIGFLALVFSPIRIIADFGLFAAIGVMLAYLVTVLLLPPLLVLFPPRPNNMAHDLSKQVVGRFLALQYRLATRLARPVVIVSVMVLVAATLWSLHSVQRDAYFVDDLPANDPMVHATRFIEAHFGGILPLDVVIEGSGGFVSTARAMNLADTVTRRLRQEPQIGAIINPADILRSLGQAVAGEPIELSQDQTVAQLIALADSADSSVLNRVIDQKAQVLRVSARTADIGTDRMRPVLLHLQRDLEQLGDASTRLSLNGFTPAAVWVDGFLVEQLFVGFAGAFFVIVLMTALLFRSVRLALMTLLPNAVPLVAVLVWMAVFDVALKPTTAIIFSISFGLGVDNTIHFLTRYRSELGAGCKPRLALSRTLAGTGRGILFSSLVLVFGFAAALFASLGTSVQFATLTIVTIFGALLAVLLLLPAMLLWSKQTPSSPV